MKGKVILLPFLLILISVCPNLIVAQDVDFSVQFSNEQLRPGDSLSVMISVVNEIDFYFLSAEAEFHPDYLQFIEIDNADLSAGGLKIGEEIQAGRIGFSVTRTSELLSPSSGDIVELHFLVKQFTPTGVEALSFMNMELMNSSGSEISFNEIPDQEFEVLETLSYAALTTPGIIELEEGDLFSATAQVYANGVSQDELNSDRVTTWVGISNENTPPDEWDESVWQSMDFADEIDGYFEYESEVAFRRELGTYYLAVRSELDVEGEFKYGGVNGIWDDESHPNATMTIAEQSPFRYTLVEWNFDEETLQPAYSLPQNDSASVEIVGAELSSYAAGSSGRALNSNNWDFDEEEPIDKYWIVELSTENLESILLSSKQYGTGTGPRDFQLQVSLDAENWTDVPGGAIEVGTNWSTGVLDQISLPEFVDDQPEVYIRWLRTSDIRIDGDESISSTGTNRLDDIIITGINPESERLVVWPGDTDNNGVVNESDVLPLAAYWYSQGPEAVYDYITWEERPVEAWIPEQATFADANGDGLVNQNDLLPVGLNFGESNSEGKQQFKVISSLQSEPLKAGEELELYILSKEEADLTGISFNMVISGLDDSDWQIRSVEPVTWAEEWKKSGKLLDFMKKENGELSAAFSYRGLTEPVYTNQFMHIKIEAVRDWPVAPELQLSRASIVSGREIYETEDVFISFDESGNLNEPISLLPEQTELLPNFPNPFNPSTTIQYTLSNDSDVTVDIYNSIGRKVATLIDREQSAGEYDLTFDASGFSSGVYFYRLKTNEYVRTRSMVLIK